MIRPPILGALILTAVLAASVAQAQGDPRRGGQVYRACMSCHSLEPGVHLTGPSLAGLWDRPAGRVDDFERYSAGLRSADFDWDAAVLDAWLADPRAMIPDTRMVFRGIPAEQDRADLVAFLALAMAPGGAGVVVERDLVPAGWARGQRPEPLTPTPPGAQVTRVRHCGDSYFVTTVDERPET
ncbi:MAG TPA: c-type cytochrome [Acidimicrobiales bacterium]